MHAKIRSGLIVHKLYFSNDADYGYVCKRTQVWDAALQSLRDSGVNGWPVFWLTWKPQIGPVLYIKWCGKSFSFCFCHRRKDRSISMFGYTFPLCARCTGLVFGLIPALYLSSMRQPVIPLFLSLILVFPLILDGGLQYVGYRNSNNPTRLLTGIMFMIGLISLLKSFA